MTRERDKRDEGPERKRERRRLREALRGILHTLRYATHNTSSAPCPSPFTHSPSYVPRQCTYRVATIHTQVTTHLVRSLWLFLGHRGANNLFHLWRAYEIREKKRGWIGCWVWAMPKLDTQTHALTQTRTHNNTPVAGGLVWWPGCTGCSVGNGVWGLSFVSGRPRRERVSATARRKKLAQLKYQDCV